MTDDQPPKFVMIARPQRFVVIPRTLKLFMNSDIYHDCQISDVWHDCEAPDIFMVTRPMIFVMNAMALDCHNYQNSDISTIARLPKLSQSDCSFTVVLFYQTRLRL